MVDTTSFGSVAGGPVDDVSSASHVVSTLADRLTPERVADLLGVTRSTISSYASRGQMPKPSPCPCCGHPTWDAQEIRTWAANRPGRIGRPKK